jgi:hypothetical protein
MRNSNTNPVKIRIPFILESGLGLVLGSFVLGLFHVNGIIPSYFLIEDDNITNTKTKNVFSLKGIVSVQVHEISTYFTMDASKLNKYGGIGIEHEMLLKSNNGDQFKILPRFILSEMGKKDWERFVMQFSKATKLPVEYVKSSIEKKL